MVTGACRTPTRLGGGMMRASSCTVTAIVLACTLATPLSAQGLYEQARAAFQRNQIDSAYSLIQRAAEAQPNRAEVHYWLGRIAFAKGRHASFTARIGLARRVKVGYSRAVALAPDSLDYLESAARYLAVVPGLVGGDRDSALVLAERARRLDATRGTLLMIDVLRRGNDRWKTRADSLAESLGRSADQDRAAQIELANYWSVTQRPVRALANYERLAARDTTDAFVRFNLGRALVVLQREPRRAQPHLWFAAHAPQSAADVPGFTAGAPWWRLGQSYVQLGMPDSGRICFEQALHVNPQLREARLSLDSLARR